MRPSFAEVLSLIEEGHCIGGRFPVELPLYWIKYGWISLLNNWFKLIKHWLNICERWLTADECHNSKSCWHFKWKCF
jgi:hypothetical protein